MKRNTRDTSFVTRDALGVARLWSPVGREEPRGQRGFPLPVCRFPRGRNATFLLGSVLVLSGCTLAPRYTRPEAPVPSAWPNGPAYRETGAAAQAPPASGLNWQEFFTDPNLRTLIATALENNRDLRLAALNVERARALYGIRRAERLPVVAGTGSASKQRIPDVSGFGHALELETYRADLGITAWEIDFFGRLRSAQDRALEEYLATEQARRSAQILLVSSVANAYLALAADRESLALAQTTLTNQQGVYDLIKRRYDQGISAEPDLFRAQTQVDAARGDVVRFTQIVAQDENALNLLLGTGVPNNLLPADLRSVAPAREVWAGLPSETLLQRPDVLQAEELLRAAYADIGAARAAFFPRISLTAAVGTASAELSGLFQTGSGSWSYTTQAALPLFDARIWYGLKVTKVQREIAVAQYEQTIQTAFREVADALAVAGTVDQQVSAQQSLVHAVAETYRLSQARYNQGIDSYLSVLDAQRALYAAQQGLVALRLAQRANRVQLYAVLGGGGGADSPAAEGPATGGDSARL
jgi:multidrug efflux system outer membrane protein